MTYPYLFIKLLVRSGLARILPAIQRHTDGAGPFLHYYSDRILVSPYQELRDVAGFLEPHWPDAIDLSLGAPRFDLVPSASTKLPADRRGWPPPWGLPELRTAVATKLHADNERVVEPEEELLITQGAAGAFQVALEAFVNPRDRVVLLDPTSPLFALALRHRRARIAWLPTWMENGRLRFALDRLALALRGARMIVINSPGNPTGGVIAPEDLEQIAWWADRRDVLIFSDEAFDCYQYEGKPATIALQAKALSRTLTAGSVSKSYALASARVGWLAGPRHLIRPCKLTAALQTAFVPLLCQHIALTALRLGKDSFSGTRMEFESRRRYAFERLQAMGLTPPWPAGAFFLWLPVQGLGMTGRAFAERLLRLKRVLVTPGEFFGPSGTGHVRLSYATEDGRLREGLGRLAEFVRELRTEPKEELKRAA